MVKKTKFEVVPLASIATLLSQPREAADKTAKPARILSVTFDRSLGATREMLFKQAGFQVKSVHVIGHAIQSCAAESFDLIVIGHSIPIEQRELLLNEVRRRCATPTLALCRNGEPPLSNADHVFDSMESPGFLLETVVEILKSRDRKPGNGHAYEPAVGSASKNDTAKKIIGAKNLDHSTV